jgi:hypothetical protein
VPTDISVAITLRVMATPTKENPSSKLIPIHPRTLLKNAWARGVFGRSNTFSGGPSSMILPSASMMKYLTFQIAPRAQRRIGGVLQFFFIVLALIVVTYSRMTLCID